MFYLCPIVGEKCASCGVAGGKLHCGVGIKKGGKHISLCADIEICPKTIVKKKGRRNAQGVR